MNTLQTTPEETIATDRAHRTIRVLFIIDHLGAIGGGESALLRIVRLLPSDRFKCSVLTLREEIAPGFKAALQCELYKTELRRSYDLAALRAAMLIRRLIREQNIDIVHTFFETSNIWGGIIAKLAGVPVLVSSRRDMGILRSRKHWLGYSLVNRICESVVAVSEQVRRMCIQEERIDPAKVVTVYNGVEIDRIAGITQQADLSSLALPDAGQIVVTIANLRHVKGIDVLIRAAALVRQEFPRATFVIVGGDNEPHTVTELRALARNLGVEPNLRFLGFRSDVFELLRAGRIFCMLSRSEGFSNTVLEAMASGLPCVVTRVGGNPEAVVDGVTGYLVDVEDQHAAADRICRLLRFPEEASRMGEAGRQRVHSDFSAGRMISDLATLYEKLLAQRER